MSIEITPELLNGLRQKAEAAEPGEWKVEPYDETKWDIMTFYDDSYKFIAENITVRSNANHIAAASPAVVLALVAEIERLNRQLFIKEEALKAIAEIVEKLRLSVNNRKATRND